MSYVKNAINTTLLPEFQAWTDEFGLVQDNDQNITTGNGILYTCHYLIGLKEKGLLSVEEFARCMGVFRNCEVLPGLLKRAPAKKDGDYQAHDDIIGILGMEGKLFADRSLRRFSHAIFDYGKNVRAEEVDTNEQDPKKISMNKWALLALKILQIPRKYVWNNKAPGKFHVSAWQGRRFDVISTMKLATGAFIDPFMWAYWAIHMLGFKKGDSHDAYILRWYMANAAEGYGWLTNMVCARVKAKIAADFGDMGFLISDYFKKPQHPLASLLKDIK